MACQGCGKKSSGGRKTETATPCHFCGNPATGSMTGELGLIRAVCRDCRKRLLDGESLE